MQRELLLLGMLKRGRNHAYQLNEFIERDMEHVIDLKKPTAYALLEKMEKQGWITQHQTQEGNRPPRREYELTAVGEAQFQTFLRETLAVPSPIYFTMDVALAFLPELPLMEAIELLKARRTVMDNTLTELRKVPPHDEAVQLVIDHHVFHTESELAWIDQLIQRLEQKGKQE